MKVRSLPSVVAAVLLMALAAFGQTAKFTRETPISKSEVPKVVLRSFKVAYPGADARSYTRVEVDGTPFYKIESVEKGTHRRVSYSPDGEVAKTEERIILAELPAIAQHVVQEKYPRAKVTTVEKITQGDQVAYEVSVTQGGKLFRLEFDALGKLIAAREVTINIVIR